MIFGGDMFELRQTRLRRWLVSAFLVATLHVAGGAWALGTWQEEELLDEDGGSVTMELVPLEAAAPKDMPDVAHGPRIMEEAVPTPEAAKQVLQEVEEETPLLKQSPLAPDPEVVMPIARPVEEQKPIEEEAQDAIPEPARPVQTAAAPMTMAPPKIEAKEAPVAVAPRAGSTSVSARVQASWQKSIIHHLNRFKRYPEDARARGHVGAVVVQFTIDRAGRVIASSVAKGSGYPLLDREALEVLERASPLPAPPDQMPDSSFVLSLPIQFRIK